MVRYIIFQLSCQAGLAGHGSFSLARFILLTTGEGGEINKILRHEMDERDHVTIYIYILVAEEGCNL